MNRFKTRSDLLIGGVVLFCILTTVLIWTNYINQLKTDREDTIELAVQCNSNLAVALEQYAIRTIRNADAVLQLVKMEFDGKGNKIDIDRLLYKHEINKDLFNGIAIIDESGKIANINIRSQANVETYVSDREYFNYHSHNNDEKLFISRPIVSRTINKSVIVLSRRISKKDGSFGGVVALQIEPSTFTSFYAQADLRNNDIISLISPDGITYARRTGSRESSGENISKSPLFLHVARNPDSFYYAKDAIRGVPSFFSYRKLKDYPIIATVGASTEDMLANYYKWSVRDRNFAIISSALILLFSIAVGMIILHRKKMAEQLLREEHLYQRKITEQVINAQEKEREEIGRELHDNVNQVLTSVKLYLETAASREEARAILLPKSIDLIMSCINEIRNLSRSLTAPTLGTKSLIDSVNALIDTVHSSSGLQINFNHSSYKVPICMNQKLAIYRILQEQFNNIIKHAGATEISVSLSQAEGHTILKILDDGKGFNPLDKRNGIGINNIISRAEVFNGKVDIESASGKGCLLKVMIPIELNEETRLPAQEQLIASKLATA
jgi:signal transduction histidine kinase